MAEHITGARMSGNKIFLKSCQISALLCQSYHNEMVRIGYHSSQNVRTQNARTQNVRTQNVRTQDVRTQDVRTQDVRTQDFLQ